MCPRSDSAATDRRVSIDVITSLLGGRRVGIDVIRSSLDSGSACAGGRGSAADVMTSPTGTDGTDGRIDIDVIQSAVGGENADVPGGAHGG